MKGVYRFSSPSAKSIAVVEVEDSYKIAEKLFSYHVVVVKGDRRRELKILAKAPKIEYEEL
ncbi:MAG TPA: hypothetical protein ENF80_05470 [Thermofilum sp.]|nr:hypothetical protein [Thermofilum sp.]